MAEELRIEEGIPVKKAILIVLAVVIGILVVGIVLGKLYFWKPEVVTVEDRQLQMVEEFIKANPKDPQGYMMKGDYYFKMRKTEEALKYFTMAEKLAPKSDTARFSVGLALAQARKFDEAIQKMEPLFKKNPFNFDAGYYLASVYYAKGDYPKATEVLQTVLEFSAGAADAHVLIAKAYYHDNKIKEAKEHLATALKMVPNYQEAIDVQKAIDSGAKID